ncbi:MAG TPA: neutral zinc metallopeptidase [Thermoanaerobaculia bacterium]|nr:neutral zinc metallopeptidase [Thermoanaerobaculia bacterium]
MRIEGERQSSNVEDRRGSRMPLVAGGGIGSVILVVLYLLLGGKPSDLQQAQPASAGQQQPGNDPMSNFVRVALAETEDVWKAELPKQANVQYREPALVLFSDAAQSACGTAQTASGPFYCPLDEKVYIDLAFYQELKDRFQAPGDFAQAYVIAHEVGHHVQKLLGITDKVHSAQEQSSKTEANALSVKLELQADCYAGVWANRAEQMKKGRIEAGDIEEALNAATAIGDDRLQRQSRGYVNPDSFTHGSSAQRVEWFRRGFQGGDIGQCDTFGRL